VTAVTTPEARRATARHRIRHHMDGDFALTDMLGLTSAVAAQLAPTPQPEVAEAALRGRLWRLSGTDAAAAAEAVESAASQAAQGPPGSPAVSCADVALMHAFETAPLWKPPVAASITALTPPTARAWLTLARHWIGVASATGDLRFLNTACKLLGAAWVRYRDTAGDSTQQDGPLRTELMCRIGAVSHLLDDATTDLARRLDARLIPGAGAAPSDDLCCAGPLRGRDGAPVIVILAGAGSASTARFITAASAVSLPVAGLCWYAGAAAASGESGYADAWYPPGSLTAGQAVPAPSRQPPQATVTTWEAVAGELRRYQADLVILLGMPVVPARILELARLGFLNAHNGALPHYRGMDAVAWALLNNDPVVCSPHSARPAVDAGEVLATAPVPFPPAETLRSRTKTAQLQLLLAAAAFVTETGRLPDGTPQPAASGRRYYRLHPHLKRVLDASPYAAPAAPGPSEERSRR